MPAADAMFSSDPESDVVIGKSQRGLAAKRCAKDLKRYPMLCSTARIF
jgi:hypothetical protein